MFEVDQIHARQILDSRGNPTLEVECFLNGGAWGRAGGSVRRLHREPRGPGAAGRRRRWMGKGVTEAVENVRGEIAAALRGKDARDQALLDRLLIDLDGTPTKSRLGANAILGASLAVAKAAATAAGLPLYGYLGGPGATVLPVPLLNVVNGGAHADNNVDVQEFMLVPLGFPTFSQAMRAGVEIYHTLKKVLGKRGPLLRHRRRGRLRPEPGEQPGGPRPADGGDRDRRLRAGSAGGPGPRRGGQRAGHRPRQEGQEEGDASTPCPARAART